MLSKPPNKAVSSSSTKASTRSKNLRSISASASLKPALDPSAASPLPPLDTEGVRKALTPVNCWIEENLGDILTRLSTFGPPVMEVKSTDARRKKQPGLTYDRVAGDFSFAALGPSVVLKAVWQGLDSKYQPVGKPYHHDNTEMAGIHLQFLAMITILVQQLHAARSELKESHKGSPGQVVDPPVPTTDSSDGFAAGLEKMSAKIEHLSTQFEELSTKFKDLTPPASKQGGPTYATVARARKAPPPPPAMRTSAPSAAAGPKAGHSARPLNRPRRSKVFRPKSLSTLDCKEGVRCAVPLKLVEGTLREARQDLAWVTGGMFHVRPHVVPLGAPESKRVALLFHSGNPQRDSGAAEEFTRTFKGIDKNLGGKGLVVAYDDTPVTPEALQDALDRLLRKDVNLVSMYFERALQRKRQRALASDRRGRSRGPKPRAAAKVPSKAPRPTLLQPVDDPPAADGPAATSEPPKASPVLPDSGVLQESPAASPPPTVLKTAASSSC